MAESEPHASASEALSNFLIEAQAYGLPVVAYEAQGNAECFVPGRTGFEINRDDRATFRKVLTALIALPPDERTSIAESARDFARTSFDPQRQVAAYLELFRKLVAAPAR